MLTYDLGKKEGPLYISLYNAVREDIMRGILKGGSKLPSKREMAGNNAVSVITVENAYSLLLSEGYIYSRPRSGYFVSDITKSQIHNRDEVPLRPEKESEPAEKRAILADFSKSQTPPSLFPFDGWLKAVKKVFGDERENLLLASPSEGIAELRRSIALYLREYRGLSVDEECIVVGAGSEYLYGALINLLGRDNIYALEDPGYSKTGRIYLSEGVKVEYIPLDKNGIRKDELEKRRIDIVHITPSHQYPTGIVMPVSRRYEILSWASSGDGRYIIEDDYDSELRLDSRPIPSFKSIDTEGRVIYLNTFSKTLSPTVRISYMVLPPSLMKKYRSELSFYSSTVSTFEQYTLHVFMSQGMMESHINRLRTYYRRKRDALLAAIRRSSLGEIVEIRNEKAGLHFLMHVNSAKCEEDIMRDAERLSVSLLPLSSFYHNPASAERNTFIMNYGALEGDKIDSVVERLRIAFTEEDLTGGKSPLKL